MARRPQLAQRQKLYQSPSPPSSSKPSVNDEHGSSSTRLQQAHETLTDILPILNAFNHRHHNQHRASHWWSTFGILLRFLRSLAQCLDRKSLDSSRSRAENVVARAYWLNSHILPRAFLCFSQLAADNQHAPLGLFLLAVLGQIHDFLSPLLPENAAAAEAIQLAQRSTDSVLPTPPSIASTEHLDRGVSISRGAISQADSRGKIITQSKKHNRTEPKLSTDQTSNGAAEGNKRHKKKKKKSSGDELSSLFGSLS